ncbi:MAG: polyprenyl synthetase family protein [Deltaproteobacteria bacterium]|jgi:geranylgeranyl diphosphate synthase type II|nr:polyprenyl synthetase family protein [Deltaproteobacteria bacterium]
MPFKDNLRAKSILVETYLAHCLSHLDMPPGLREAMNYSLLAGGKRLRPALCLSCAELFGLEAETALPFAAALECIHSYSLIHDDLPAMDNDDLRRGKPSNHKRFGEAAAILAGDGLLTDAFIFMASASPPGAGTAPPAERTLRALRAVAVAAGSQGMVGGQYLDMLYTSGQKITLEQLRDMQAAKTGALITVSCVSGAILAGAKEEDCVRLDRYGRSLGAAFQIVDDILDEEGDEAALGKPVGSDAAKGKITYPSLLGVSRSRALAEEAGAAALDAISVFSGTEALFLRELVEYVLQRSS